MKAVTYGALSFQKTLVSLSSFIQRFPDQLNGLIKLTHTETSSGDIVGKPVVNEVSHCIMIIFTEAMVLMQLMFLLLFLSI